MAQVPDYTAVGTQVPTTAYRRPFFDQSGRIIQGGIESLGAGLEQSANELYTHQVNYARAQASNALLDHQIATQGAVDSVRQGVASGDIAWDQAGQAFEDATGKLPPPTVPNLDPIGQENLNRGLTRNLQAGRVAVAQVARLGQRQDFADQFDAAQDKLGKLAGAPGADIEGLNSQLDSYRPMALEAGINPATVDKAITNFKERNWLNQATQRSMESKDDPAALEALRHDLVDPGGLYEGKLNVEKRDMVLRGVINDQLILQNRAEHLQDKREAKAQHVLGQIDEQIGSGIPATPTMWEQWGAQVQGTSAEDDFKQRMKDEDQVQAVLREPVDQQLAYVQQRSAQLDSQGGTLRDRANLIRLSTAVRQNVNTMQTAPLLFGAHRNGTDVTPIDFS
ncbi:MAG: hypothetical protein ACRETS_05705, partial [Steroidobacteraceae bacterium]